MKLGKKFYEVVIFSFFLMSISVPVYAVKSVYVISDTGTYENVIPEIQAYRINGSSLEYQTSYNCQYPLAIGLAIDPCSQILFVTHEDGTTTDFGNIIEIVNAKTMQFIGKVEAIGASNLAGITFDKSKNKVYAVDRYTNKLYSWTWNPAIMKLLPDFEFPYYKDLNDISSEPYKGAFGIALDEEHDLLYVADNTKKIKYYNTNTWSKVGEIPPNP